MTGPGRASHRRRPLSAGELTLSADLIPSADIGLRSSAVRMTRHSRDLVPAADPLTLADP
ncbi:hypothetical protein FM105_01340 [Brevibacterium yomogidense]|uniref:Uncharacterized protein n=1 Tax=Brevibacterium yomogidense TaxID=946573 RepID=A0A1X6WV19_9MICO|nr:hypothetical protein FM105_01340 [Brevibacterium yomogidense]